MNEADLYSNSRVVRSLVRPYPLTVRDLEVFLEYLRKAGDPDNAALTAMSRPDFGGGAFSLNLEASWDEPIETGTPEGSANE